MPTNNAIPPWTIKGIPPDLRGAAIEAAQANGLTIGAWLKDAITRKLQPLEPQDLTIAPDKRAHPPASDLDETARLIDIVRQFGEAIGRPLPRTLVDPLLRLLQKHTYTSLDRDHRAKK